MKTNKKYGFIIFDWDGTLMDSTQRIVSAMQTSAQLSGLVVPSENAVKSIIGLSMQAVMETLFPNTTEDEREKFLATYRFQYIDGDTTPSPLFEGALSNLQWLKQQAIPVAVATGKARAGLNRVLKEVSLEDFFDFSICADEAESKPHPEMVFRLMKSAGFTVEETLVVGDSIHDLKMAANAGVDALGVMSGANQHAELVTYNPVSIIQDVSMLRHWLEPDFA